jgi:fatty acid desaturase
LLLLPVYATAYEDDEGQAHALFVHGQTGWIHGPRRASMRRARRVSLIVGLVALAILAIGLATVAAGLMVPPLAALGIVGVLVALVVGIGALVPMLLAWQFNRRQEADR